MSRQDIADYVGLTIETVSRTLTQLESLGAYWRARSASNHIS
jgi:CRP/FNR family nitrogen fixation transcriptional regulator